MSKIAVIGAGAFGTALACSLASAEHSVVLWGRDADQIQRMRQTRRNARYLPDIPLPDSLTPVAERSALAGSDAILVVTPAQRLRTILEQMELAAIGAPVVLCSKGIEQASGLLQSDVAQDFIPKDQIAVLSGPGFASEIASQLPTALTIGAFDREIGAELQHRLTTKSLRLYLSDDPTGVQLGGALKNVYAIACGFAVGAGLGESARAALITRGFAEMSRLALAMGAMRETLHGLSGFGDLALSCTSAQSRNFAFGLHLAQTAQHDLAKTVEGIATAKATNALANRLGVELPIAAQVVAVLEGALSLEDALGALMSRPLKPELPV
ncbi:glycerol-3-phosphate dehydrogenase [NAD(P)+] [Amylibacter marinus]|uniref:Glycerol-3-phosphate dehydrogenase [NAD(P)+] n=1 Tax=Amylibacter marinus TaxID=1475483 RepID=A0ABQ5VWH4_9RHOB|nr:NAD(P)H-dependent glycerol-3-phosphate dehydrogenase [Amylibacter marinus]GLQ35628.1 glycerol-3-phosphate dehydrogenase [NAD(P)+] [Amylibacter marinus]